MDASEFKIGQRFACFVKGVPDSPLQFFAVAGSDDKMLFIEWEGHWLDGTWWTGYASEQSLKSFERINDKTIKMHNVIICTLIESEFDVLFLKLKYQNITHEGPND